MKKHNGIGASNGISAGKIHIIIAQKNDSYDHLAGNSETELKRFERAYNQVLDELEMHYESAVKKSNVLESDIFDAHLMMLRDPDFVDDIKIHINDDGYTAEFAVDLTAKTFSDIFSTMDDAYMKERAADVFDITGSIKAALTGEAADDLSELDEPAVIASEDLLPSQTIRLDKSKILAIVTQKGSTVSHTAILARGMGIPAVVGAGGFDELAEGTSVIIDGGEGLVIVEPDNETESIYRQKQEELSLQKQKLECLKDLESVTVDGVAVEINANIGNPSDVDAVLKSGAAGIGLFRTEFLYMESAILPDEQTQFEAYKSVLQRMDGRRVIIRTLDIGADKRVAYLDLEKEENPAMGRRAIRLCLDRTDIFITQLRALYRASVYGNLNIMIPMIISEAEILSTKEIIASVKEGLLSEGAPINADVPVGIMIETPASAIISDRLAKLVDFFSIGTNDLTQYTQAVDRMNTSISGLFDPACRAVLRLIAITAENAHKSGIWVGICGESAANPELAGFYAAIGISELSVSPTAVLTVKEKIRQINVRETKDAILKDLWE